MTTAILRLTNPQKWDRVILATASILAILALLDTSQLWPSLRFTGNSLIGILPFIALSVAIAAYTKASRLDSKINHISKGNPLASILVAALFGTLSPFCSCGVIPLIAGLLRAGVPVAPVMAFWISSPLMDPEMFVLTAAVFGAEFTTFKTIGAFAMGAFGGLLALALTQAGLLREILKAGAKGGCGSSCGGPIAETPVAWKFWHDAPRREAFLAEGKNNGFFLLKWLTLAFLIESLMVRYVPMAQVGSLFGDEQWWSIPLGAAIGIPAYLNGYAAIPTVSRLIEMGMGPGAGMTFMLAGSVSSIPAAMSVYALVKKRVFFLYLIIGLVGAISVGYGYELWIGLQ